MDGLLIGVNFKDTSAQAQSPQIQPAGIQPTVPGSRFGAHSGLEHDPRVISPVLLGFGDLLHAVALGADGASQEKSYVYDRTATAFPRSSPCS